MCWSIEFDFGGDIHKKKIVFSKYFSYIGGMVQKTDNRSEDESLLITHFLILS